MRLSLVYLLHFSDKRTILYYCGVDILSAELSCFFISGNLNRIFGTFFIIDCLFNTGMIICWIWVFDGLKMAFESFWTHSIIHWILDYRPRKRSQLLHYYGRFYNQKFTSFIGYKGSFIKINIIEPKCNRITKTIAKFISNGFLSKQIQFEAVLIGLGCF